MPGEHVELRRGQVWIDGVPLDESAYIFEGQPTQPTDSASAWDVPDDAYFVLGDHRVDSIDSRMGWLGMVPDERVIGRAAARYWPVEAAAVLSAPEYPELRALAAASEDQPPTTHASIARP